MATMAPTTFSTAVLLFINLWLIALTAFGTAASAIFLYILGAVDHNIGASVTVSIVCVRSSSRPEPSVLTNSCSVSTVLRLPRLPVDRVQLQKAEDVVDQNNDSAAESPGHLLDRDDDCRAGQGAVPASLRERGRQGRCSCVAGWSWMLGVPCPRELERGHAVSADSLPTSYATTAEIKQTDRQTD